ncbi:SAM domain-containing protein SAMSN-1b [Brachionichthys hirsutus]|uniref:SAM domain-containing protein SAMSN-1b n=1 Tax=Brachionichthys hirsutus TaxID=412623 RepID=UPI003604D29D
MKPEKKKTPETAESSQEQQEDQDSEEGVWSPFERPQPWTPFHHACHQPRPGPGVCRGEVSLPWATESERFESFIWELDNKQSDPSPPQAISSGTDLPLRQNTEQNGDLTDAEPQSRKVETSSGDGRKQATATLEKTAFNNRGVKRQDGDDGQVRNSLESLYSLKSGQSSSSGVTSGSDCSSNRDSLRLEDNLSYTRQFCGRARVHTDNVPSPYDTESLNLKVGDVIEVIAKPPMGIWTGMLNGRIGKFKFIYVDALTEESPGTHGETQTHKVRQASTVRELLRRIGLEEYSSSLQLNSYQTVDDLATLREHHLTGLRVTDPEHRRRLLAAVDSLQQLLFDSRLEANREGESLTMEKNTCPRDSGCHLPPCSSPVSLTEDAGLSGYPPAGEATASCG